MAGSTVMLGDDLLVLERLSNSAAVSAPAETVRGAALPSSSRAAVIGPDLRYAPSLRSAQRRLKESLPRVCIAYLAPEDVDTVGLSIAAAGVASRLRAALPTAKISRYWRTESSNGVGQKARANTDTSLTWPMSAARAALARSMGPRSDKGDGDPNQDPDPPMASTPSDPSPDSKGTCAMTLAIHTRALTKRYGSHTALHDLDLKVERGSVFGLIGPNGAGKTTTLRMLLDIIRPTSGDIDVLGERPRAGGRGRCGGGSAMFQANCASKGASRAECCCVTSPRSAGRSPPGSIERLAERLDLDLTRPVRTLSKGNKQKLGLVQAFMHQPQLLVLDEPTSGLDPLVQREFLAMAPRSTGGWSDRAAEFPRAQRDPAGCR